MPDDYLLSHGNPHYHWRGIVSRSCSGWEGVVPIRYGHQAKGGVAPRTACGVTNLGRSSIIWGVIHIGTTPMLHNLVTLAAVLHAVLKRTGYRIKPHGQLVLVSLTHYCASTPSLSTSWSRTTLQGNQVPRDISSQGEFPA